MPHDADCLSIRKIRKMEEAGEKTVDRHLFPLGQRPDTDRPPQVRQSERRRAARPTSSPRTRASPAVAHARSTPIASESGSRPPASPGPRGRVVGTEAARASFKSPPRDVAERPWRFRGITCSGCSRARQAWAAGRSAADSSPWAPRRSRTSPGTSRCHVRARRAPAPPRKRERAGVRHALDSARNAKRRLVPPADDAPRVTLVGHSSCALSDPISSQIDQSSQARRTRVPPARGSPRRRLPPARRIRRARKGHARRQRSRSRGFLPFGGVRLVRRGHLRLRRRVGGPRALVARRRVSPAAGFRVRAGLVVGFAADEAPGGR